MASIWLVAGNLISAIHADVIIQCLKFYWSGV